jgi:hypothetical protein
MIAGAAKGVIARERRSPDSSPFEQNGGSWPFIATGAMTNTCPEIMIAKWLTLDDWPR